MNDRYYDGRTGQTSRRCFSAFIGCLKEPAVPFASTGCSLLELTTNTQQTRAEGVGTGINTATASIRRRCSRKNRLALVPARGGLLDERNQQGRAHAQGATVQTVLDRPKTTKSAEAPAQNILSLTQVVRALKARNPSLTFHPQTFRRALEKAIDEGMTPPRRVQWMRFWTEDDLPALEAMLRDQGYLQDSK